MHTTLIDVPALQQLIAGGQTLAVFDCSFDLFDPDLGRRHFEETHLPGARHAHLDHLLSEKSPDQPRSSGGRHPLPSREVFARRMRDLGLNQDTQVVVYDRQGANYSGRLWWMLRWCGHPAAAVLDGGLQAWQAAGCPVESGPGPGPAQVAGNFQSSAAPGAPVMNATELRRSLGSPDLTIIDARAPARYRGETEPLDPVAGHIPGAFNRPFGDNLGPDGRFKSPEALRREFAALLGQRHPAGVVHHCGSGVSAIPNVLAMAVAGWGLTALFPGSWSEWCETPGAVFARG
ncbi:MAG: sulfurtransferase [Gammaproteobacteria bacterium]